MVCGLSMLTVVVCVPVAAGGVGGGDGDRHAHGAVTFNAKQ